MAEHSPTPWHLSYVRPPEGAWRVELVTEEQDVRDTPARGPYERGKTGGEAA